MISDSVISICGSRVRCRACRESQPIADAEQDLADDDDREGAGGLRQREQPGRNGGDREPVEDQRRGVVGKPFALEHHEDPARHAQFPGNRERRHHVRRGDDRPQQEADAPGQPDQVMRRGRDRERREDHAADRQQDDRAQVEFELAPAHGDARRIDQRRQHHQQHQFGRQFHRRHARHEGERDAGEHQQDGRRDIDSPRQQRGAGQHGEQDQKDLKFGFHDRPPFAGKNREVNCSADALTDWARSGFRLPLTNL